jgi:hypothetical protein
MSLGEGLVMPDTAEIKHPSFTRKATFVCVGLFVVFLCAAAFYPVKALIWHCDHPRLVRFDTGGVTLPILWWRESASDNASILIRHAAFGYSSESNLKIFPLASGKTKLDDQAALAWQHSFIEAIHAKQRGTVEPVNIRSKGGTIYCTKDFQATKDNLLVCRIPGIGWGMSFEGLAQDEPQAEGLIASFRFYN